MPAYHRPYSNLRRQAGFTLIELMITVAIIVILLMTALPSYRDYVRRSTRAEAQAYLMAVATRQQQFLLDTRAYASSLSTIGVATPANVSAAYTLTLTVGSGPPPTYTLTASPKTEQSQERCGTLSINQAGSKTAAIAGCW